MNQVILIHGMPSKEEYFDNSFPRPTEAHWLPWIKSELGEKEVETHIPAMPEPYLPDYKKWLEIFEQFKISNETILVGHSCGGGFLIRYFSEHPELKPKKMILVAPWIDPEPHELITGFFDFTIDPTLTERTDLVVFYSTDDDTPMIKTAEILQKSLPNATYHKFEDKGHFTETDLGTKAFPELLKEILK